MDGPSDGPSYLPPETAVRGGRGRKEAVSGCRGRLHSLMGMRDGVL